MNAWQPEVSSPMRGKCPPSPRRAFFWRPGVRPPPPVGTKRELSGQSSPAAPQLCQHSAQERARCPSKIASHFHRGFTVLYEKKLRRAPSALRRGGLGSDGFDSRPDDDASRFLIQRTLTLLRCSSARKIHNDLGSAKQLCAGAKLVPARDAGACFRSEVSPVCVVTKMCPPTHGRAARAKLPALHPAQVSWGGPEGAAPARCPPGWAPAAGLISRARGEPTCPTSVPSESPPAECAALVVAACVQAARRACRTVCAPAVSCARPGWSGCRRHLSWLRLSKRLQSRTSRPLYSLDDSHPVNKPSKT